MRYQAALRPEPLGSNTRTIASQPSQCARCLFVPPICSINRDRERIVVDNHVVNLVRCRSRHFDEKQIRDRMHQLRRVTRTAPPVQSARRNQDDAASAVIAF